MTCSYPHIQAHPLRHQLLTQPCIQPMFHPPSQSTAARPPGKCTIQSPTYLTNCLTAHSSNHPPAHPFRQLFDHSTICLPYCPATPHHPLNSPCHSTTQPLSRPPIQSSPCSTHPTQLPMHPASQHPSHSTAQSLDPHSKTHLIDHQTNHPLNHPVNHSTMQSTTHLTAHSATQSTTHSTTQSTTRVQHCVV